MAGIQPRCDLTPTDPGWRTQHVWTVARQVALTRAEWTCEDCGVTDWDARLHVHHRQPVAFDGYGPGCQHHHDNLRVLCVTCHTRTHQAMRAPEGTQLALHLAAA